jgi:two-component system, NarL family, nitrate/nitrite response regulator NarL
LTKSPFKPVWSASNTEDVPSETADDGERTLVLIGVTAGGTVVEALSAAKAMFPDAPAVVVGDSVQRELVTTALATGATTFIDENVATPTLIKELELIVHGEPVISVLILKRLLETGSAPQCEEAAVPAPAANEAQPPDTEEAGPNPQLSGREAAILKALVQGTPNKVIASRLNITEATVKVHVKAILRKIQVKNRTQAAIWGLRHYALRKPAHPGNGEVALTEAAGSAAAKLTNASSGRDQVAAKNQL